MNIAGLQMSHDVQNEVYVSAKANALDLKKIANDRLDEMFKALASVTPKDIDAMPSYVEVVDLFVSFFDDVVIECALLTGRRAETEKNLLNLCKEALGKPSELKTRDSKKEHIVATFIDSLILHEAPLAVRAAGLSATLIDATNPLRLGLTFYKIFCEKYPGEVDARLLQYFKLEEEARMALVTNNAAIATDKIAKLFELPINEPEKYLLMSLNSFYNGLTDDARRVLDIGLSAFPGNQRLQSAKDALAG
ncbi:MAG: hypothetical protein FWB91_06035 [Defluviitaleaceae bacterium]|nr:hypothetical protein [Defluviitaleaceae bacterium]